MSKLELLHSDDYSEEQLAALDKFCRIAGQESKHPASVNMDSSNWKTNKASLLYLLLIEGRFKKSNGGLYCYYEQDEIIAVSGFYKSDFDPDIYLCGVRSWVLKKYRLNLLLTEKIIPLQLEEISKRTGKAAVISFNDSTKSFAKLVERSNKSPESKIKLFFGNRYPKMYEDMIFHEKPVIIKNTKQWILVKYLQPHPFDWSSLEGINE